MIKILMNIEYEQVYVFLNITFVIKISMGHFISYNIHLYDEIYKSYYQNFNEKPRYQNIVNYISFLHSKMYL